MTDMANAGNKKHCRFCYMYKPRIYILGKKGGHREGNLEVMLKETIDRFKRCLDHKA